MNNGGSLVASVLRARYFPQGDVLDAELGPSPSFTWRSLHGAIWAVKRGIRWLIGDGRSEVIANIPLSDEVHEDRRVWHYTTNGEYSVRSAYHMIMEYKKGVGEGEQSSDNAAYWRKLWQLKVPPRIRMFCWRISVNGLATRLRSIEGGCGVCGAIEESDLHALLECPQAEEIWLESGVDSQFGGGVPYSSGGVGGVGSSEQEGWEKSAGLGEGVSEDSRMPHNKDFYRILASWVETANGGGVESQIGYSTGSERGGEAGVCCA
ncbi:hypothetical protein RDABS01_015499 [Bienertia sinuspersici]